MFLLYLLTLNNNKRKAEKPPKKRQKTAKGIIKIIDGEQRTYSF
jgi:hypothetical protein